MAGRSPARFIAPLALVAFALALFIVVGSTRDGDSGDKGTKGTAAPARTDAAPGKQQQKKKKRKTPKTYVVKEGDTPSGIAVKVNVPLDQLLQLNPDLDPQAMTPGMKLKVR
jgi:LysM repeat protein